jgi:tRNA threonylcarbamoyl adenosine modification protein YeaZ
MIHGFIYDILAEANVGINDLNGVAVAIGPGSFTGLRVGLATAKGICWPKGLPLAGISSLLAVARCAKAEISKFLAIKDAKRDEFYYGGFIRDQKMLEQIIPDSLGSVKDIINLINDGFAIVGPGTEELNRHVASKSDNSGSYDYHCLGGSVALEGISMISMGRVLDLAAAIPNYIRAPKPKEWKSA